MWDGSGSPCSASTSPSSSSSTAPAGASTRSAATSRTSARCPLSASARARGAGVAFRFDVLPRLRRLAAALRWRALQNLLDLAGVVDDDARERFKPIRRAVERELERFRPK